MRDSQVRLSSISKEIERVTVQDCVGNPTPVSELAACLFDLRAAHEAELRMLTWIQTTLEGIRSNRACGDPGLLFREMARLIRDSEGASTALAAHRRAAVELLSNVIAETGSPAREPKPLAVVAA